MQYFKEYHDNIDNIDIVKYNNDIINNRSIINDEVYVLNNEVIGIKKRDDSNIVGILYLDSKIKYGSYKDKLLYLFKPTNKEYPNFYVPYKKSENFKIYVVIKFKEWKTTNKLTLVTLIEIIGKVGDKDVEFEHLRFYYNIKNKNWKVNEEEKNIVEKEDFEVFSIDPIESKDIDDAFHFKYNSISNKYEIGIHIASPTKYFENNLEEILKRVSTVYLPGKKYNMLPNNYADNIISLLENKKRYALSLILYFENNILKDYIIKETIVKNIKNYNYEEFDKIFKYDDNLVKFMNFTKDFFKIEYIDSHKLVEYWMIYTNKKIASYLIDKNLKNLIIRVHKKNIDNTINNSYVKELDEYLKIKNENSAIYELYDNNKVQTHSKLCDEYYTHFTSPIRRAIDFFIHMLIIKNKDIMENNLLEKYINYINIFTKNVRKFDRNIRRLNFLYNIKDCDIQTYCYIIKIKNNIIKVFIPEYNLEEKCILVPKKFDKIANINYTFDNDIITSINYSYDNINGTYNLYDMIKIKLWIFTSFDNIFDKLKIEIIS